MIRKLLTMLMALCMLLGQLPPALCEAAEQLEAQAETAEDEAPVDNAVAFYRDNQEICDAAYAYYLGYEEHMDQFVQKPLLISSEELTALAQGTIILVMTANPIERGVLLRWLSEKNGNEPVPTYRVGEATFNLIGLANKSTIIHLNPGKTGEEYTRKAINRFCKEGDVAPDYIVLAGICYGMNKKKHTIGTVFISDNLKTFRLNFRDYADSDDIRFEVEEEYTGTPSKSLIQRIEDTLMYSRIYNIMSTEDDPVAVPVEVGTFLSCNSLMSSQRVKQAILDQYSIKGSQPLGGEMEGAGLLKSNIVEDDSFDRWLIIKSICDWGEKKNAMDPDPKVSERIKDSLQAYAMTNTCSVLNDLLDDLK